MRHRSRFAPFALAVLAAAALWAGGCKETESSKAGGPATGPTTGAVGGGSGVAPKGVVKLQTASYDPTVELYKAFNPAFQRYWKDKHGQDVVVETSHGPSGTQAQKIIAGLEADVAALSVDFDVDKIAQAGLLDANWRARLPNESVPYTSAVVFMVRKGNPKNVKDWEDLARDEVVGVAPDPKTGGGARWIYLSAWAHALRAGGDEAAARAFTGQIYDKALLDPAMRGSTSRFVNGEGDVLFGWENEILQIINNPEASGKYDLVVPSDSITIEVPIAVVDSVVKKHGNREVAEGYVNYLYSPEGQEMVAKFYNRPFDPDVAKRHADKFKPLQLFRFKEHFKDWNEVMKQHFVNGGELDKMRGSAK
jgi:sulfate transport system substrate-binding protein